MTEADGIQIALTHYRTLWFDAWDDNDWDEIKAAWQTEYDAVSAGAFKATLMTTATFEGGTAASVRNFEQAVRLRALQLFRAELDSAYAATLAPPTARPAPRRSGYTIRFSP